MKELEKVITLILKTQKKGESQRIPILLKGVHGIGKSSFVENYTKKFNLGFFKLLLSHQNVEDLIGIPYRENNITKWSKPEWLDYLEKESKNKDFILFLDELNRASLEIRQTALEICLEGRLHLFNIPKNVIIIAAINESNDIDYQVEELDAALLDRFMCFEMEPDLENFFKVEKNLNQVVKDYLIQFPQNLFKYDEETKTSLTPRSWTQLSRVLNELEEDADNESLIYMIIKSKLGKYASPFFQFWKDSQRINWEVLNKKDKKEVEKIIKNMDPATIMALMDSPEKAKEEVLLWVLNVISQEALIVSLKKINEKNKNLYNVLAKKDKKLFAKALGNLDELFE